MLSVFFREIFLEIFTLWFSRVLSVLSFFLGGFFATSFGMGVRGFLGGFFWPKNALFVARKRRSRKFSLS